MQEAIVLHSDVLQQAQFIAIEQKVDPAKNPYLFEEIYLSTLNDIINRYAVLYMAERDTNLVISNDDVDNSCTKSTKKWKCFDIGTPVLPSIIATFTHNILNCLSKICLNSNVKWNY